MCEILLGAPTEQPPCRGQVRELTRGPLARSIQRAPRMDRLRRDSVVRLDGNGRPVVVPDVPGRRQRRLRALQDRAVEERIPAETVPGGGHRQGAAPLVREVEGAAAAVGEIVLDVEVADGPEVL